LLPRATGWYIADVSPRAKLSAAFVALGLVLTAAAERPPAAESLVGYDAQGGAGKKLFVVPIEGTIDLGLAPFVERVAERAGPNDVILLRIKTFGGRIDAAVRIRDALLDSRAKTVAYVDHRAISAGALISLACDSIVMSPGASIGAATPVQQGEGGEMKPTSEKVVSYMRAEMRATAEAKERRADVAEAMVDADVEIPGVSEKGKLLTLTSDKALALKVADATAPDFDAAIALLNLTQAERVDLQTSWGEKIARLLTDPIVSSLLMTFGFLGLLMELYTPGFGVGGTIGVVCLALFFLGQYAAHLAGWEELLIFAFGFVLLLLEVFVIPGFGITGVAGIGLMVTALVMAMIDLELPWDVSFELGYAQQSLSRALVRIAVALAALLVGAFVFGKYFPGSGLGKKLILASSTAASAGYVSAKVGLEGLVGKQGTAHSTLRPAGIALIEGRRVDVVSEGEFIDPGAAIEVVQVDGNRVVVRKSA